MAGDAYVTLVTRAQPVTIVADADRILQTLTNLISNAIKFSEAGMSVVIAVGARDGEVHFDVSDTGRGIPADKLGTIFGRFERAGRCLRLTRRGWHGPWSGDLPRDRRTARRPDLGSQPARRRRHLLLHSAGVKARHSRRLAHRARWCTTHH